MAPPRRRPSPPINMVVGLLRCLLLVTPATARPRSASDYLSDVTFPGLHVLEPSGSTLRIYQEGQDPKQDGAKEALALAADSWSGDMAKARQAIEEALKIPAPVPYQLPWAIFDYQGRQITAVQDLMAQKVAFLTIIGRFMWPAVRVGFEQEAEGIRNGETLIVKTLSIRPAVFEVAGFILPHEADRIIQSGKSRNMVNSVGSLTSEDAKKKRPHDDYRTSTQTWLARQEFQEVQDLDDRTANLTKVPVSHNEPVQVLRYDVGQFYAAHNDWQDLTLHRDQKNAWLQKHYGFRDRMATLFWYLSDVTEGGVTVFPKHGQPICPGIEKSCPGSSTPNMKRCDLGLQVQPKKGNVILWYNYLADGRGDQNALHGGCPPGKGQEKWSGNKWIHTKPLNLPPAEWMPDHPAIRLYGYQDAGAPSRDAVSCLLIVRSDLQASADVMWLSDSGTEVNVGTLEPGGSISMHSTKGHKFLLNAASGKSEVFPCVGAQTRKSVSAGMVISDDGGNAEL
eukprot:TRINITY_DN18881_c0_g1_i1.p1 TRINITY_DN18881_c0_g1~~TRINITY_DN18881_c0_g1_i1.p1  ORF type:complete len:509 (+),score=87.74 TRINITY_DN18881_c0_g1_i1:83-1609(+)